MDGSKTEYADVLERGAGAHSFYCDGNDALQVIVRTAVAVTISIEARFYDERGYAHPLVFPFVPANLDRSANTTFFPLHKGWLLDVTARAITGSPEGAQTYVTLRLQRGQSNQGIPIGTIVQGYVTRSIDLAWPNSPLAPSVSGIGLSNSVAVTTPGAGADWSVSVPTRARWRLENINAQLVTAAAPSNREAVVVLDDGINVLATIPSGVTQVASTTVQYSYFQGATRGAGAQSPHVITPLPFVLLGAGWRIRSSTVGIQAADQWSNVRVNVEEWIED